MEETKYIWLKCKVVNKSAGDCVVEVPLLDGTPATIKVHSTLLRQETDQDYVRVEYLGKKATDKLIYIKLPRPSLEHGHYVTVKQSDTMK